VTSIIRLLLLCPSTNPCGSLQHWSESLRLWLSIITFRMLYFLLFN
jgi:hypothetical protein